MIYLPAVFMSLPEGNTKKESQQAIQGNKERILLVEDEKDVREFIKQALYINGYRVFEASKIQDALDIFDKEKGNFDLLFSDVVLSDGTGIQLADQLIALKPKLQVLLSSGYTEQKSQWSVISQKGYRFLQKPYELAALLSELRKALSKNNFEILHSQN
jgi:DNA-binding NtrC family response regulator